MASIKKAADAFTREASIKRHLRKHLAVLGFQKAKDGSLVLPEGGKEVVRTLHSAQREERLREAQGFVASASTKLLGKLASGADVVPSRIRPSLQRVSSGTWESDLFRLVALSWSVPVSVGFGRRIRYLVWDESNGKLIGIAAIGDPVYNLSVRDKLIGWSVEDRGARLVNLMDAYVLGAIPPYSSLLGGKLVACLLRSRDVYDDFAKIYGSTEGVISGEKKKARLLGITTTSSMGRSSVYNRLKLHGVDYFRPIGYTGGWGHFHIPEELFSEIRDYLRSIGHPYADKHEFGDGPNWRLRTVRAALDTLGFKQDLMKHGIQREVFLCETASNSLKILGGKSGSPKLDSLLSAEEVGALAVERWMIGRADRRPDYQTWTREDFLNLLAAHPVGVATTVARKTAR
ncbi:DUF4338 domain-containing protein [Pelomonas sp. P7]|uniref:DUF4338 domain-containing protein n=1 Tax=Pelomonas caseinilytica TaxID=2906763 RepID=A0ABS8XG79_9BURK|nr:Druantia anti-phage system protein DruA [Pelomonas sp. P7]MCE4538522.1 DUF4338 domain-containing protein [Pelomonas sp. P7]